MTRRESILAALLAVLDGIDGPTALRNAALPEDVPADGLMILRDGNPGTPEVLLSPLTYLWTHRAELEVFVQAGTAAARDEALDDLLADIAAAIADDRTLGGLCDWVEAEAAAPADLPVPGADGIKAVVIPIVLEYDTDDRLGLAEP